VARTTAMNKAEEESAGVEKATGRDDNVSPPFHSPPSAFSRFHHGLPPPAGLTCARVRPPLFPASRSRLSK
jgi:hypothetical protein